MRLYKGCWGIARDKTVHGPMELEFPGIEMWFKVGGRSWLRNGWSQNEPLVDADDIIRVFPSESEALAYLNKPSVWARVKAWVKRTWDWKFFTAGVVIGACILVLLGCTLTDQPPDPKPSPICRQYGFGHDGKDSSWTVPCDSVRAGGLVTGVR